MLDGGVIGLSSRAAMAESSETSVRARLDAELSPSRSAKDAGATIAGWLARSSAARECSQSRTMLDVVYGHHPRQRLDLWAPLPTGSDRPVVAFVHGGFWQEGSKAFGGFPGPVLAEAGMIYAAIGYRLAPEVPLSAIVGDVAEALRRVRALAPGLGGDPDRIVVAGHSAGAHLAAMLLASPASSSVGIGGLVLISGVFDLAPVALSYVNDAVRMTGKEIPELSPTLHVPRRDVPVAVLVGSEETPEFRRQSARLAESWRPHLSELTHLEVPGRDHFDIVDGLALEGDPVLEAVRRQAGGRKA